MFISCWKWRVLHCWAYLLFLPLAPSVSLPLSFHHSALLPVAVSLFISPSVTYLHHLHVSNFPFSPPFCYSLAVVSCFLLYSYIATLFPLTLPSLPLPLCLCTLSGLLPSSPATPPCFLLCVCCLFRLALLHSEGINPYTCQRVVEATRQSLFRPSGGTAICTYTNAHNHTLHVFSWISHVTGSTSLRYFIVCLILCFYPVCEQMNEMNEFCGWFEMFR